MQEQTNKKRKAAFPVRIYVLCLLLVTFAVVGVTFSKYIVSTGGEDAARVATFKNLDITETGNYVEPQKWAIAPGVDIQKKATVNFEASEMACYVFLEVKAPEWQRTSDFDYNYPDPDSTTPYLAWSVASGWDFLTQTDNGAVYYRVVEANTPLTADIISNDGVITVSKQITKSKLESFPASLGLTFAATAVQYHGFEEGLPENHTALGRATAAWNAVKDK